MNGERQPGDASPAAPAAAGPAAAVQPPPAPEPRDALDAALEALPDGYFLYDAEWRLVYANAAARAMFAYAGLDADAVLGTVIWDAVPGLRDSSFHRNMLRCAEERVTVRFEGAGSATGRFVETTAIPVTGGVAVFSRDVGDRSASALRQRLLMGAGALLSRPTEPREMLHDVARIATREFSDACVISITDEAPGAPGLIRAAEFAHDNAVAPVLREIMARFPLPANAQVGQAQVMRTGHSQILREGELGEPFIAQLARGPEHLDLLRSARLGSALVVPLTARARTIGALTLLRHAGSALGSFDNDDLSAAEEVGRRVALAIDNARLFAAERAARARAERLQDLATALSAATTFADVADAILTEGMALVGATGGRVVRPPEPGETMLYVVDSRGWSETERDPLAPISVAAAVPTADAVARGTVIWVRHGEMAERYPDIAHVAERGGHRTWIAVPFRLDGRKLGAVGLALPDDRPQSDDMLALLRTMAHQCSQAIERIRLFEAAQAARQDAERERADLKAVLDVTPIGIGIARDTACSEILVNPALGALLGVAAGGNASKSGPAGEGLPFRVYDGDREVPADELPMQRAARDGETVADLVLEIVHDDGRRTRLLEYAAPLLDEDGRPRGAVGAFVDVTERSRLLEAEQQARLEAETARAEAEAANKAKSDFLAMMSHELRTPLNAIAGYVELLGMGIRGPVNEQQRSDLARIRAAQQALLRRIDDVLNYARIEAGQVEFECAPVEVAALFDGIEPLIAPQADGRDIRYACGPCEDGLTAFADAEKAEQVLVNLVANAIKFTPPGGTVTVAAERAGDRVIISVTDTGVGIPADKLAHIFDPFMQVDTRLTRVHGGAGLGLAISRDLMRGMGGDLSVESVPGAGSTFRMSLPAA